MRKSKSNGRPRSPRHYESIFLVCARGIEVVPGFVSAAPVPITASAVMPSAEATMTSSAKGRCASGRGRVSRSQTTPTEKASAAPLPFGAATRTACALVRTLRAHSRNIRRFFQKSNHIKHIRRSQGIQYYLKMAEQTDVQSAMGSKVRGDFSKEPILVVLTGLPGCGKSNFCYDLFEEQSSESPWVVICQDTLGTRKRCIDACKEALISGKRVIIDRCNQSVEQRAWWIDLANKHWPFKNSTEPACIFCVDFNTPFDLCVARTKARGDHPTVPSHEAEKIIACQAKEWEVPTLKEGFTAVVSVEDNDTEFYRQLVMKLSKKMELSP